MINLPRTEGLLKSAQILLERQKKRLAGSPDDWIVKSQIEQLTERVGKLKAQVFQLRYERGREVVTFRFLGEVAQGGTLPLALAGELSSKLASTLLEVARFRPAGRSRSRKEANRLLDLRQAAVLPGSTQVVVSGKSELNLFEESLLESTLHNLLSVLQADTPEELHNAVSTVGSQAARTLRGLTEALVDNNLELNVKWQTPKDEFVDLETDRNQLLRLTHALNEFEDEPVQVETYIGLWRGAYMDGQFRISIEGGGTIQGTFLPESLLQVQQMQMATECRAEIAHQRVVNKITGAIKHLYVLRGVTPLS